MKASIIGAGYVGLTVGVCLAELGVDVLCMDNDERKILQLQKGQVPFYEPDIEKFLSKNLNYRLHFSNLIEEAVDHGDVIFMAVGTPASEDGSVDLRQVFHAARSIACSLKKYTVIVDKSTVPVGTARMVKQEIQNILVQQGKSVDFDVVSNPEFLSEGNAVKDFMYPSRLVIGYENQKALDIMLGLYQPLLSSGEVPLITSGLETAELIKYACNAFLATKISFINEISNLCELCNADVVIVSKAMGLDGRIGAKFLNPGPGYGGSCFPKDTRALIQTGRNLGYTPQIIKSAVEVNDRQKDRALKKIRRCTGRLKNKNITLLGIAFKPGTDDTRDAPSLYLIHELLERKARVKITDPAACNSFQELYPGHPVLCFKDPYEACTESDCIVLVTEWPEYARLDFAKIRETVRNPVLVDLRNLYDPEEIRSCGFTYEGVGRK